MGHWPDELALPEIREFPRLNRGAKDVGAHPQEAGVDAVVTGALLRPEASQNAKNKNLGLSAGSGFRLDWNFWIF